MLTRRDIVHSRQFLGRRLHTALVAQRPDPLDWPGARLVGTTLVAVMLCVISIAVVGIYGFIRPAGATGWSSCDRVIIEEETGTAYVCDGSRLYPVLNFASAALLRGLAESPVQVSRASLTWPRGPVIGIPDAPNSLPGANDLLAEAWSFCARPTTTTAATSVMLVGVRVEGTPLLDEVVAVRGPGDQRFLVLHGRRHPVTDAAVVSQALAISDPDVLRVGDAWLATLPLGPQIAPIVIGGRGGAVAGRPQASVGQILVVGTGIGQRRFVGRPDGLQPITAVQEALIRATAQDARAPIVIDETQLAGGPILPPLDQPRLGDGTIPQVVTRERSRGTVCQVVADSSEARVIVVAANAPAGVPTGAVSLTGTPLADEVVVPPGRGALVAVPTGTVWLVTETGHRHAIASGEAASRLGYEGASAVALPSSLVERLRQGPTLSVDALAMPAS